MPATPPQQSRQRVRATAKGERIYAIGDVHGRYDLLRELLRQIEVHSNSLPEAEKLHILLLGDLIDRGPESAQILRYVYELQQQAEGVVVLMGNHEEMLLRVYDGEPGLLRAWMRVGGEETLRSFGIEPPQRGQDSAAYLEALRRAVPREWIDWLRRLPLSAQSGDYYFCHAGVRPGIPLRRQVKTDLIWIREEFLKSRSDHGAMIVHGHSITPSVAMEANRIGIDTGAYDTGVLTALYLEGRQRSIIATTPLEEYRKAG